MSLTIISDLITSDRSPHTARPFPGHSYVWQVTWLSGHVTSPSGAVTAMMPADVTAGDLQLSRQIRPHVTTWAAALGLTATSVIALASAPPDKTAGREPGHDVDRKPLP